MSEYVAAHVLGAGGVHRVPLSPVLAQLGDEQYRGVTTVSPGDVVDFAGMPLSVDAPFPMRCEIGWTVWRSGPRFPEGENPDA